MILRAETLTLLSNKAQIQDSGPWLCHFTLSVLSFLDKEVEKSDTERRQRGQSDSTARRALDWHVVDPVRPLAFHRVPRALPRVIPGCSQEQLLSIAGYGSFFPPEKRLKRFSSKFTNMKFCWWQKIFTWRWEATSSPTIPDYWQVTEQNTAAHSACLLGF